MMMNTETGTPDRIIVSEITRCFAVYLDAAGPNRKRGGSQLRILLQRKEQKQQET